MATASLNPETFTEGGGLVDDADVIFSSCLFEMCDYQGKVTPAIPSLKVEMQVDGEGDVIEQYFSLGSPKDWAPSDDGKSLEALGNVTGIRTSSNGGIFLKSLVDSGFPADKLGDDVTVLDGLLAHVIRVPAPKRPGIKKKTRDDGREYEDTVLVVSEVKSLPWEKKKPKGSSKKSAASGGGKKKATGKKKKEEETAEEGTGGDVEEKAVGTILEILAEEETITKKELPAKIFKILSSDTDRNKIVKMVFDDEFLSNGPWDYDDGVLTASG